MGAGPLASGLLRPSSERTRLDRMSRMGVLQHFDPPHQVLFHVLLPLPLTLKERHLSLKHIYRM
ncbi:hypothetical protein F7725_020733, partial [Dissostichus mawsoni]